MPANTSRRDAILAALKDGPLTAAGISEKTGLHKRNVDTGLAALRDEGLIEFAKYEEPKPKGGRVAAHWKIPRKVA